ncbi:MAG: family 10 glycosylhydrolase [Phycisphaerae bacterium]|nr:family 10 glycosylhydrolase [Phycisphaerae bacterium]
MKALACTYAIALHAVLATAAQIPPPPKPDCPLFHTFNPATERAAWKPMELSPPVSVVAVGDARVLEMHCPFDTAKIERASWDLAVPLDMAACQGIRFSVYSPDPAPISSCTAYLKSGGGWYALGFSVPSEGGWHTITLDKDAARIEDKPAGWGRIDTLRLSAWRGKDAPATLYLANLGLLGADAPIVLVRAESAAKTSPSEVKGIEMFCQAMAKTLESLGLPYCTISDLDLTAQRLQNKSLLILPHNPGMPDDVADHIAAFLKRGGKLICFYSLPSKLRDVVGIGGGRHVKPSSPDQFAAIGASGDVLRGAPPIVKQRSWNISEALPVEGKSRAAAEWLDAQGRSTGQAAVVVSDNCIRMTHVMLEDDATNKRALLLAMIGHFLPNAWRDSVEHRLAQIGRFGPYKTFDEAKTQTLSLAAGDQRVRDAVEQVSRLRDDAAQLSSQGKHTEALAAADKACRIMLQAYVAAQKPLAGEHRAFWCHSAFGVDGMTWDQAIKTLADNGFTAILPNMLWGGVAYYDSKVLPVAPEIQSKGDQIAQCLAACKKHGIQCHVWKVNYNARHHSPKAFVDEMTRQGRTQVRFDGKPEQWLCPSHPENQKLEIDSMVEVATKYDVDGIHFDYIRYPGNHTCFCDGCRERFEKAIGEKVDGWPNAVRRDTKYQERWNDFRRQQITAVVAGVAQAVRKAKPNVKISAAVFNNWPTHRDTVAQDWKLWCEKGYLDFVCPMDYTRDSRHFDKMVGLQVQWAGKVPCYPGIGLSVWRDGDICRLIEQIDITRKHKTGGFTVFNYGATEANEILPLCGMGITRKP